MASMSKISWFSNHGSINSRSPPSLILFLLRNAGEKLEPELASHLEPRVSSGRHSGYLIRLFVSPERNQIMVILFIYNNIFSIMQISVTNNNLL